MQYNYTLDEGDKILQEYDDKIAELDRACIKASRNVGRAQGFTACAVLYLFLILFVF